MLTETKQDIEWPDPVIIDPLTALGEVTSSLERVRTLFSSNTANLASGFVDNSEGLSDIRRERAYNIWLIYNLAEEHLGDIDRALEAIDKALWTSSRTPVGKHVDIQHKRAHAEALEAFRAANAVPIPDDPDGFDRVAGATLDALLKYVATRSPDLRSLHEKMFHVQQEGAIHTDGVIDALFADVEHLARRYEIARDDAPAKNQPEGRANWESAVAYYHTISAAEKAHPMSGIGLTDPDYDKVSDEYGALLTSLFQAFDRVVQMPAPDYLAVAEKLDVTLGMRDEHDHVLEGVKFAAADIRRLCGEA